MARIRFEGLAKRYAAQTVLAPLDLVIEDGEFFTFVGPSGCGKSTLLNLVAGVDVPSAGTIRFDDREVTALPPGERDVAMVFQSYALYPHLTVRDNIGFPLKVRGVPRADAAREVERVAQTLGLGALLDRKPRQLSGGQRQRVALGRALVRKPTVFLMDEPLSNLDARLRLEMREELKRLHETHRVTTIYVTHDQEEAMALSGRMAVLSEGRIQQCGAPQAVYDDPANLFVARFIGSPPINLLPGDLLPAVVARSGLDPGRVQVGLRPADLKVNAEPGEDRIEATVVLTEPAGSGVWVIGETGGQRVKGRAAPSMPVARGATVHFRFDPARAYYFDRESGERVRARAPEGA